MAEQLCELRDKMIQLRDKKIQLRDKKIQLLDMLLMREGGKYNNTIQYLPMQIKVSSLGAGVR